MSITKLIFLGIISAISIFPFTSDTHKTIKEPNISAVLPETPEQPPIVQFTSKLSSKLMQKELSEAELTVLTEKIRDEQITACDLVQGFTEKGSFDSNADFIEAICTSMLNRSANSDEISEYTNALELGLSKKYIISDISEKDEFKKICRDSEINSGTVKLECRDKNPQASQFIQKLFNSCLDRRADETELNLHTWYIYYNVKSTAQTVFDFISKLSLSDDAEFIKTAYSFICDGNTVDKYIKKLNNGTDKDEILKELLESDEFKLLCEGYGLDAGALTDENASVDAGPVPYPKSFNENGGKIVQKSMGQFDPEGVLFDLPIGQVENVTHEPEFILLRESKTRPEFNIELYSEPQVLIYHTHTTESYEPYDRSHASAGFGYRTTDPTKNTISVGNEIIKELEAAGIGAVHDTGIYDYPQYDYAYDRSRVTILEMLKKYPSIKVTLDIHRDALGNSRKLIRPVTEVDGKTAAQVMIVSGCDDGTLNMDNYKKNFRFACMLQQQLERDYTGITRPILFDYRRYNQDLTTGSLLLEIGSHGCTLEQVQYTGQLVGKTLAKVLTELT